ncbi:glycosyl transferase family protein [Nitratireductor indicus C115]|uniref:Glycosyl transferase family protein n=1 Tax=Nitratireductor indicus C115 TaxID=1231190 RepID=K2NA30_9HYPH|nr:glycosyl transferase family protein [Nitratireductor indicus C115]SFQ30255.1 Glycosyltransferase, catalytic subunit of cellulose synthase and poly-beta-1,6-N-acetylglucosamine synthase [Nitratireductor indicus]
MIEGGGGAERKSFHQSFSASLPKAVQPSPVGDWQVLLKRLNVPVFEIERIAQRAEICGVSFQTELLASGAVSERELFRALADDLGLAYLDRPDPSDLVMREWQGFAALANRGGVRMALTLDRDGRSIVLIAPDRLNIPALRSFVRRYPRAARRLRVVPPSHLRETVRKRFRPELMRAATDGLFSSHPKQSSRFVVNAWQGAALGALLVTLAFFSWTRPAAALLSVHGVLSVAFLACVVLRIAIGLSREPEKKPNFTDMDQAEAPVYSVLIALYKEADVIPDLLSALGRLVWPRSKLEIKLVCESDDRETLEAIRSHELRPYIEVIEVPAGGPRTKPKALSYALPMTSGEFVALYDAEDRPQSFQLVEAWQAFRDGDEKLACVQAPLTISNSGESWISSMFALEYAALFRVVLPWLARRRLMLPLGGTSNHFRRSALNAVGGWDPYNVTEDADLGLRLCRFGYRTSMIANATYEDAPTQARVWVPQRTRWFKGWAQTWLVHMRDPGAAVRELGLPSFVIMQVLFAGMVLSALAYSIFWATVLGLGVYVALDGEFRPGHFWLLMLDGANVVLGHAAFLYIGWLSLNRTERAGFWKKLLWTPAYWCLMSLAAWRCLWQLYWNPHHWEKTPHKPYRGPYIGTGASSSKSLQPEAAAMRVGRSRKEPGRHVGPGWQAVPPFARSVRLRATRQTRKPGPEPMMSWSSAPIASRSLPS